MGKLGGLDTRQVTTHEFTHSMFSMADKWSGNPTIHNPLKAVDELQDFVDKINDFFIDQSPEALALKKQNFLKIGNENLNIATYSKRIEDKLFGPLSQMAAEEARANTGANLLGRLAYGDKYNTPMEDVYRSVGGFSHYLKTESYAEKLLRKHPLFGHQEVEVGDRGLRVTKPIEDFPELLEQLGKTKKEISLRVDMRVNAEYLGQLGEFGPSYSKGPQGIQSVIERNARDIFDRAYAIHGDHEKALEYLGEYGDLLGQVSQDSRKVGMSISTIPELGKLVRRKNITRCN